ncbi:MAG: AbiJ-NTD4 domain-containing protein [Candidatus Omnitrophota bacterium]
MEYFSDQEHGQISRTIEIISSQVWDGIVALVETLITKGAFGNSFPNECPDGNAIIGTERQILKDTVKAEIPNIEWPLNRVNNSSSNNDIVIPDTLIALDLIQFCYKYVSKPETIEGSWHNYYNHYHLSFDKDAGEDKFREQINMIFSRNGMAYELKWDGNIERLVPPVLREQLASDIFNTGDNTLDSILNDARRKFLNPDIKIRKEALDKLWDSWERLKTIVDPTNKKGSINRLLEKTSSENNFRSLLDDEAKKLTEIGNKFHIRHSEINQIEIQDSAHIDYLFHRMWCMIYLLLKK